MSIKDKITGRVKQAAGDLADDPSLHREGRQEERKGEAKEELADAQDKAARKAEEVGNLERKTNGRADARARGPARPAPDACPRRLAASRGCGSGCARSA